MRTTVDMSDDFFHRLKVLAARRGVTLKSLFETALRHELSIGVGRSPARRRLSFPLLHSKKPSSLSLTNAKIDELLA